MGKKLSRRPSLKMASVIRKKSKAKKARDKKEAKNKQFPKRTKKLLVAPKSLPNREAIEEHVHESSKYLHDVIRQIESTRTKTDKNQTQEKINTIRKQIKEAQKVKIEKATATYQQLLDALEKADAVIEVLDARDPNSCRLLEAESEAMENKKKPLLIIINKIDLIPREIAESWIAKMSEVAPTIGISAINGNAVQVVKDAIASIASSANLIAVIGIRSVGKSTICGFNPTFLKEVASYEFIAQTPEVGLLRGVDYLETNYELCVDTISRCDDNNVFLVLEIPVQDTPKKAITEYGKKWNIGYKAAGSKIIENIWNGKFHFFASTNEIKFKPSFQSQVDALTASAPLEETGIEFIHITEGEPLNIDEETLGGFTEEDDDE